MKTAEVQKFVETCDLLLPVHKGTQQQLTQLELVSIKHTTDDRLGEFVVRLRASDCLNLMELRDSFKAQIEQAQLDGKDVL